MTAQIIDKDWNPDDWETPDNAAQGMARLIKPSDRRILEPFAGTGQIVKYLPKTDFNTVVHANEINPWRWKQGRESCPWAWWMNTDFFGDFIDSAKSYDVIISNPPFSLAVEGIERSLTLLNPNNPDARLLFLLPMDWLCSKGRGRHFNRLDAHISHIYPIMGRVAYLRDGVPYNRRQIYDAVWTIKPGKEGAIASYLEV